MSELMQDFAQALTLQATLGSQFNQALPTLPDFAALQQHNEQSELSKSQALLHLMTAWQWYAQAAMHPNTQAQIDSSATSPKTALSRDTRQPIPPALLQLFETLSTDYRNESIARFSQAQWFIKVMAQQQIIATEQVSDFLTRLPKLFRPLAHQVLSQRAQWYASQQGAFDWVINNHKQLCLDAEQQLEPDSQAYWHSVNLATQQYLLSTLRKQQPEAALNWLISLEPSLKTEQLKVFVEALVINLSLQDADFLQNLLKNSRSQQLKVSIASLLMQLPQTSYYQAMQDFFGQVIRYDIFTYKITTTIDEHSFKAFLDVSGIDVLLLENLKKEPVKRQLKALVTFIASLMPLSVWQTLSQDMPTLIQILRQQTDDSLLKGFMGSIVRYQDQAAFELMLNAIEKTSAVLATPQNSSADKPSVDKSDGDKLDANTTNAVTSEMQEQELVALTDGLSFASNQHVKRFFNLLLHFYMTRKSKQSWQIQDALFNQMALSIVNQPDEQLVTSGRHRTFELDQSMIDQNAMQQILKHYPPEKIRSNTNGASYVYQLILGLAHPQQLNAYFEHFANDELALWQLRERLYSM